MSFFSDTFLNTKSGPLARVWLASHLERKLTKSNLLQASIPASVEAIVAIEVMPMALRLSGQLLLGIARIYARKAKYLADDCSETLNKVRSAFRMGAGGSKSAAVTSADVDLPLDQQTAAQSAITRPLMTENDLDFYAHDMDAMSFEDWQRQMDDRQPIAGSSNPNHAAGHTANLADITLAENHFDLDIDLYGPDHGIDSQHFDPTDSFQLDLGLDLDNDDPNGKAFENDAQVTPTNKAKRKRSNRINANGLEENRDEDDEDDRSIELGRDAVRSSARKSARMSSELGMDVDLDHEADVTMDSAFPNFIDMQPENDELRDRSMSVALNDSLGFGADAGAFNLDLDLSGAGAFGNELDLQARQSTPHATGPAMSQEFVAAEKTQAQNDPNDQAVKKKRLKKKIQPIVDDTIELASPTKSRKRAVAPGLEETALIYRNGKEGFEERKANGLIISPAYLPSDGAGMHYLEIRNDPVGYYVRQQVSGEDGRPYLNYAPPGLPLELAQLFWKPVAQGQSNKRSVHNDIDNALNDDSDRHIRRKRFREDEDTYADLGSDVNHHGEDNADRSIELGRRDSSQPASRAGSVVPLRDDFDFEAGALDFSHGDDTMDNFRLSLEPERSAREGSVQSARSNQTRRSAISKNGYFEDEVPLRGEGALSIFDDLRHGTSHATTPARGITTITVDDSDDEAAGTQQTHKSPSKGNWSRSTVTAVHVLAGKFSAVDGGGDGAERNTEKTIQFKDTAEQASKRAAAAFFFELLVLGSRDCIKLDQPEAYGDIKITAKNRLYEVVDSVAPSTRSMPVTPLAI